jgi:nucleotide-binding universal stress UspA family protein
MAERQSPIRRILVALDASPASRFTIQTAVDLAARFEAELIGLFVEDTNLLRVARLPFVREIGAFSFSARKLDLDDLQRQLRDQAERMRRSLASAARLRGISWEFRVKRGPVAAEVMAAGAEADLMIMGRAGRSLTAHRRLGSTVRSMVLQRSGMTFILTAALRLAAPAILLYDGSQAGHKALEIAGSLVAAQDRRLTVVLVAESRSESHELKADSSRLLSGFSIAADFRTLVEPSHRGLAWLVRTIGDGPVILPCGKERLQGEPLCTLVDEIPNPVLLVR